MSVQSIERAFTLLRALAMGPAGVTDLADRVGLPKSTAARLLSALEDVDAIVQDAPGGHYRISPGLRSISESASPSPSLASISWPYLEALTTEMGEIAGIEVLEGTSAYTLQQTAQDSEVQVRDWTGDYTPLHVTPGGLGILAHQRREFIDDYLSGELEAWTARTVTDPAVLRDRIENLASIGYAWGYEECAEGINSVAAPILLGDGVVVGAVHLQGPAYRFPDPDRSHDIGRAVADAARQIAGRLSA